MAKNYSAGYGPAVLLPQERYFAPQKNGALFSPSDTREVDHRPADWVVIFFATLQWG